MICCARANVKEAQEEFYCFLGKRISFLLSSKNMFNSIKNISKKALVCNKMLMILMDIISVLWWYV